MEPLGALLSLLRPRATAPKVILGAGHWAVRYGPFGQIGYGLVIDGRCRLDLAAGSPLTLSAGDFLLLPPGDGFRMSSADGTAIDVEGKRDRTSPSGEVRYGDPHAVVDFQLLGGYFSCDPAQRSLLRELLPTTIHIEAKEPSALRLSASLRILAEEARADRPGRDLIVERLLEVLLVEALRFHASRAVASDRPGLLTALSDVALSRALRALHADVARGWTVAELAREAALSRSTFSERFAAKIGLPPMEYLLQWRMAIARDLLRKDPPLETVAAAIGYESASAFSTAFRKRMGVSPGRFGRELNASAHTSRN
ncbi:MAG: AraC family transcriptional regulator [Steroidobacteraceae bacterium]